MDIQKAHEYALIINRALRLAANNKVLSEQLHEIVDGLDEYIKLAEKEETKRRQADDVKLLKVLIDRVGSPREAAKELNISESMISHLLVGRRKTSKNISDRLVSALDIY